LGAGDADSPLSPNALRDHIFFALVDWASLWTCPVPELAHGLYIRPPLLDSEGKEYDPGATWDALATGDGIEWLRGQHITPEFIMAPTHSDEIAPHQLMIESEQMTAANNNTYSTHPRRLEDFKFGETNQVSPGSERPGSPNQQPSISHESHSGSSSSEHETSSGDTAESTDLNIDLAALKLNTWFQQISPDEIPILTTDVESRVGLRERASSIIPSVIPSVTPRRTMKKKKLLLTSERLIYLKVKENQPPIIKTEIFFDMKGITVERKGEREFIVHCVSLRPRMKTYN
jgi:3-phosphoinositide dependent protein kinase-1